MSNFGRTFGNLASPVPLSYLDDNFAQLETATTSTVSISGAALVGFVQSGSGAITRTVQSKLRDVVNAADFGVEADTGTDQTAELQAAVTAAYNKTLVLPPGTIDISTAGGITQSGIIHWKGDSKSGSILRRSFSPSGDSVGAINLGSASSGTVFEDLQIKSKTGTTGGCLVSSVAVLGAGSDFVTFKNCVLTFEAVNTYKYALYLDGSARTGAPIGIRDWALTDVDIFGGTSGAIFAKGVQNFTWKGGGAFPASSTSAKVVITGDATVGSSAVSINISYLDALDLDRLQSLNVQAAYLGAGIVNTSNVVGYSVILGQHDGAIQTNWSTGTFISEGSITAGGALTIGGSLVVNGNTTLGDVGGDTVTINASSGSAPNNFALTVDTFRIIASSSNTGGALYLSSNGSAVNRIRYAVTGLFAIRDDVAGADRISIGTSGEVGIGIASSSTTRLALSAGATGMSSLRLPHGSAPSSPVDGDMWTTSSGLFVRINGSTVGPLS